MLIQKRSSRLGAFLVYNSLSDKNSNLKISHLNKTFQKESKHFRLLHALEMKYKQCIPKEALQNTDYSQ